MHAMRDPTRGGIAGSLNEIARQSQVAMEIIETRIPVKPAVAAACEALGLDVFKVANEGKMLIIVAPEDASRALVLIRRSPYGEAARIIGEVTGPTRRPGHRHAPHRHQPHPGPAVRRPAAADLLITLSSSRPLFSRR